MVKIIAFSGADKTGKSTMARALAKRSTKPIQHLAFADPIYEKVAMENEMTVAELRQPEVKPLFRDRLREVGENFRNQDRFHWVNKMMHKIARLNEEGIERFIIDDLRFEEEFLMVKQGFSKPGVVVYINRYINPEEMENSTFRELPEVKKNADFVLPARYDTVENMVDDLLAMRDFAMEYPEELPITLVHSENIHSQAYQYPELLALFDEYFNAQKENFPNGVLQTFDSIVENVAQNVEKGRDPIPFIKSVLEAMVYNSTHHPLMMEYRANKTPTGCTSDYPDVVPEDF